MLGALVLLLQQGPDAHYAGGASSKTAGTTAAAGQFFRFLFSTVPQWVQIGGILVGGPVALILAWQAWKHRRRLWAWWLARPGAVKAAIVGGSVVTMFGVSFTGLYGYNYMMHENDFCQSCHVMDIPWNRFQTTAHKELQCHACHRQPMYVSSVELFWWVTERRMTVPAHDKVPTAVCSECHMRQGTDSARTLVTLTAGHAVHLNSDSSALKQVECVTCHGRDFHVFIPNNATCAQSGCHVQTKVNLGSMSGRGFIHCTLCHDFKNRVDSGVTVAQAKVKLVPQALKCTKCHEMSDKMKSYDLAADPHKGNCGACHDAHKQTEPKEAFKTCATAQCHAAADTLTPFHRGLGGHALDQCGACHQAHSWKVKGTNCLTCHKTINQDRRPPKRVGMLIKPIAHRRPAASRRAVRPVVRFASFVRRAQQAPPAAPQSRSYSDFPHSRHASIGCTQCHSTSSSHGGLKFSRPEGCMSCHHATNQRTPCSTCHAVGSLDARTPAAPNASFRHTRHASVSCAECHGATGARGVTKFNRAGGCVGCHHAADQRTPCTACHNSTSLGQRTVPVTFAITARKDPVTRAVPFAHARHGTIACARCHANDAKRTVTATCTTCHTEHHGPGADCASCHATARTGHDRSVHEGCAGCHTDSRMAALPASRALCLSCHQPQRNHFPTGDCAVCHALDVNGMLRATRPARGR